jgi:hypothetical protein
MDSNRCAVQQIAGACFILACLLFTGCGGGGDHGVTSGPPPTDIDGRPLTRGTGSLSVTISPPEGAPADTTMPAIPAQSQAFRIRVENPFDGNRLLAVEALLTPRHRPQGPLTASFSDVRAGPVLVRIHAFATADGIGQPLLSTTVAATVTAGRQTTVAW